MNIQEYYSNLILNQELIKFKSEIKRLEEELSESNSSKEKCQQLISTLQSDLRDVLFKIFFSQKANEVLKLRSELSSINSDLESNRRDSIKRKSDISELQTNNYQLQQDKELYENKYNEIFEEKEGIQAELLELKAQTSVKDQKISSLTNQLNILSNNNEKLKSDYNKYKKDFNDLQLKFKQYQIEHKNGFLPLPPEYNMMKSQNERYYEDIKEKNKEIQILQNELIGIKSKLSEVL